MWFDACLAMGKALRASTYSTTRLIQSDGAQRVEKTRRPWAPLLVRLGAPLARALDTGVRVLPQREWEDRERMLYRVLYDASVERTRSGTLLLPRLGGRTLAALLENPPVDMHIRTQAIRAAVVALEQLHLAGFTHGDAMAENVLVDEHGVARWFDFETVHDTDRPEVWQRADDLRALLSTCALRTPAPDVASIIRVILDAYTDEDVKHTLPAHFESPSQRALVYHLGQAPHSFQSYRRIAELLRTP